MDPLLHENLITTKDAGELSGYTSDYLSRLVRSGKLRGKKVGHAWLIERESLVRFLDTQGDHKIDRARALAHARAQEYRAHRSFVNRATRTLTTPITVPEPLGIAASRVEIHALAFSLALAVVISGALAARAAPLPSLATDAAAVVHDVLDGFYGTFGDIPSRIAARIHEAETDSEAVAARVATRNLSLTTRLAPVLGEVSVERMRFAHADAAEYAQQAARFGDAHALRSAREDGPLITAEDVQAFSRGAYAFIASPSYAARTLAHAYVGLGMHAYAGIEALFSSYRSFLTRSGDRALALASSARDTYVRALVPLPTRLVTGLGESVVAASHAAIRADVALAYGVADAAPASARATVAFIGGAGDLLARGAARLPERVASAYLRAAAFPAEAGPALARAAFNAEYAVATRFVAATGAAMEGYALALRGLGEAGYAGTEGAISLARTGTDLPQTLANASLGVIGKGALAFDSIAQAPKVAMMLAAVRAVSAPLLAAAEPVLSPAERVALATYEAVQGVIASTSRVVASLFSPPPTIVMPSGIPKPRVAEQPKAASKQQTVNSYTTVVQGVTHEDMARSLVAMKDGILGTVAGMVAPVAAQSITNMTTIQQVARIEDLSNLIVKNGDFRGGTWSNGRITSSYAITSENGTFSNTLTGGTTSLATTTITGDLAVSGTITPAIISAGTSISAPYFIATSTTATSTFAGRLAVGTTTPWGDGIFTVGVTSPFLHVSSNTGYVGIGTSTPATRFAVAGSGYLTEGLGVGAVNTAAGSILATATTTALNFIASNLGAAAAPAYTFAGDLATGFWSPAASTLAWSTGGTERMRLNASGNVGIASTSPSAALSVNGTSYISGTSFFGGAITATSTLNLSGLATFSNGFLSNASSTITSGLFSANGGASTTQLTATGSAWLATSGGSVGIGTTSPAALFAVQGGSYVSGASFFGGAITATSTLALGGSATLSGAGAGITFSGTGNHDITASAGTLRIGSNTIIGNIEALDDTVDIGTAGTRFDKIYANEVNATTLVGTLTGGNLTAETFTINSDNATADTENSYLAFERGSITPNALLTWNATGDRFEFNQPLYIENASASTTIPTLEMKSVAGQTADIFRIASSSGDRLLTISASGNLGLGTTSPYSLLSVSNNLNTAANTPLFTIASTTGGTATSTLMTVLASGRLGIGTTAPATTLHISGADGLVIPAGTTAQRPGTLVTGTIRYNSETSQFEGYGSASWGSLGGVIDVDQDTKITAEDSAGADNDQLKFFTAGSERMRLDSNGNLGLATTSPFALLSVAGLSGGAANLFAVSTSTASATTTALTIDRNGNLALLNGANLSVGGNLTITGNTTHTGTLTQTGLSTFTNGFLSNASSTITSGLFTMSGGASTTALTVTGNTYFPGSGIWNSSGNVGIGTTTPIAKLALAGGSFFQAGGDATSAFTASMVGGVDLGVQGNALFVSDRYAFVAANSASGNDLHIYDITDPTNPVSVGGADLGVAAQAVYAAGHYAYVGTAVNASGNELRIFDIARPAAPIELGGAEFGASTLGMVVSGRYLYVLTLVNASGSEFKIYDIANPKNPVEVGSAELGTSGTGIFVAGRYAYVTTSSVSGNDFRVFDVSNPTAPTLVGGADMSIAGAGVYVSGRYAYVVTSAVAGNDFKVFDVKDPTTPTEVGGVDLGIAANGIYVSGRYAYLTLSAVTGNEFKIFDLASSTVPVEIGGAEIGTNGNEVQVVGKYAYVVNSSIAGNEFRIYDITGAEVQSMLAHSLEAGNLQVRNDLSAQGQLTVSGGASFGQGGLMSQGPGQFLSFATSSLASVHALSAFAADSNTASVVDVFNIGHLASSTASNGIGTGLLFSAQNSSGTTTSIGRISSVFTAAGGAATTSALTFSTRSGYSLSEMMRLDSNGNLGVGTTSPYRLLSVAGSGVFGNDILASTFTATSTTASVFPYASTTALTVSGQGWFGTASTTSLIVSGTPTFQSLSGILSSNGTSGSTARTLTGTTNQITVTNGDGISGNPTFSLPSQLAFTNASSSQLSVFNNAWFGATATSTFTSQGWLGIGTSTPNWMLSVAGAGSFDNYVRASYFSATSTTATSTIAGFLDVNGTGTNATSTFASNLWVKGTLQTGTGSMFLNDGGLTSSDGNIAFNRSGISHLNGGNFGIGTTSPAAGFAVQGTSYVSGASFFGGAITATSTLGVTGLATFASATTTGNLSVANNLWIGGNATTTASGNFTTNGTIQVSGSGQLCFSDATCMATAGLTASSLTATVDSVITSDSDLNGTGDIALKTGATDRLHILNNGNVGISNTSPLYRLSVYATDSTTNLFQVATTTETGIFVVNANGYVGVGSSTPAQKLSVAGTIYTTGGIQFPDGSTQTSAGTAASSGTTGQLPYYASAGTSLTATSSIFLATSGNVGIGTTNPGAKLMVAGSFSKNTGDESTWGIRSHDSQTMAAGVGGGIVFTGAYTAGGATAGFGAIAGVKENGTTSNGLGNLAFYTTNVSSILTERVRIDGAGNVGIGTTSPASLLYVQKDQNAVTQVSVRNYTANTLNQSRFSAISDSLQLDMGVTAAATAHFNSIPQAFISSTADIGFSVGSVVNAMFIKQTTGNVGIGTTTPSAKLEVYDGALVLSKPTADNARNYRFMPNTDSTGDLAIQQSTASGGSTYATKLTIDVNGNVGIGDTTPSYKLEVNGSFNATSVYSNGVLLSPGTGSNWSVTGADIYRSSGLVGIGTASPAVRFHVKNTGDGSAWSNVSTFQDSSARGNALGVRVKDGVADLLATWVSSGPTDLTFTPTTAAGVQNEAMRIANSGNVGIGTTSPNVALDISNGSQSGSLQIGGDVDASTRTVNTRKLGRIASFAYGNSTAVAMMLADNDGTNNGLSIGGGGAALNAATFVRFFTGSTITTAAGTERVRIDSAGLVGVGTTSPWGLLSVNPNGISGPAFVVGSSTATNFIVTNQGYVGVGVTAPVYPLEVAGTIRTQGGIIYATQASPVNSLVISNTVSGQARIGTNSTVNLALGANSDYTQLVLQSGGNVGIGTTGPGAKLEIEKSQFGTTLGSSRGLILDDTWGSTNSRVEIGMGYTGTYSPVVIGTIVTDITANTADDFYIATRALTTDSAPIERLRVTKDGNVGIGTTTPGILNGVTFGSAGYTGLDISASTQGTLYLQGQSGGGRIIFNDPTEAIHDRIGMFDFNNGNLNFQGLADTGGLETNILSLDVSSGNVGIGTTTPFIRGSTTGLAISGAGDTGLNIASTNSGGNVLFIATPGTTGGDAYFTGNPTGTRNMYVSNQAAANLYLGTGGVAATHMAINSSGNVGIGTTNPSTARLKVIGTTGGLFQAAGTNDKGIYIGDAANWVDVVGLNAAAGAYNNMNFRTSGTDGQLFLKTDGNVGIGDTTPSYKLEVAGDIAISSGSGGVLRFADGTTMNTASAPGTGTTSWGDLNFQTGGAINFQTGNGSATSTKMTVTNAGLVGIGTASPSSLLHIYSTTAHVNQRLETNSTNFAEYTTYSDGTNSFITGLDGPGDVLVAGDTAGAAILSRAGNNPIQLATNGSVRMTLNGSGYLGIGTTNPVNLLTVAAAGSNGAIVASTTDVVGGSFSYVMARSDSSTIDIRSHGSARIATRAGITLGGWNEILSQNNLGTNNGLLIDTLASVPIVFGTNNAERMRIDGSGNVGIGTTSPAAKLEIHGSSPFVYITASDATVSGTWGLRSNVYSASKTNLDFYEVGVGARMSIANGGNIGVASTTPWGLLSVNPNGITGPAFVVGSSTATKFIVDNSGNVGIGTASPSSPLTVYGTDTSSGATNTVLRLVGANGVSYKSGGLFFKTVNSVTLAAERIAIIQSADQDSNARLLSINPDGGNIGIGTTSPSSLLHVYGAQPSLYLDNTTGSSKRTSITFLSTSTAQFQLGTDTGANSTRDFYLYDSTQGAFRWVVNSSGNVGIGTTTPTGTGTSLEVGGGSADATVKVSGKAGTNGNAYLQLNPSGNANAYVNALSGYLALGANGAASNAMTIISSGYVGIGDTTPSYALDVAGDIKLTGTLRFNDGSSMSVAAGTGTGITSTTDVAFAADSDANGSGVITYATAGAERMRITNGGYVGIGTAAPRALFDVTSGTANTAGDAPGLANITGPTQAWAQGTLSLESNDAVAANTGGNLTFKARYTGTEGASFASIFGGKENATDGNLAGYLRFITRDPSLSGTEKMRITSAGNVGIGTTTPTNTLTVVKGSAAGAQVNINDSVTGGGGMYLQSTDMAQALFMGGVEYTGAAFTARAARAGMVTVNGAGAETGLNFYYDTGLTYGSTFTPTERMRLSSSGYLGIGDTAPAQKLTVLDTDVGIAVNGANMSIRTSDAQAADKGGSLVFMGKFDAAGSQGHFGYIAGKKENGTDSNYAGYLQFGSRPHGGNMTERMRITSTGNVGIGTTSPAEKLVVNANTTGLPAGPAGTLVHIGNADSTGTRLLLDTFAASPQFHGRRAQGTAAAPSAIASGNALAQFAAYGYGATGYSSNTTAAINITADQNWTDSAQGSSIRFYTSANDAAVNALERLRISNDGNIGIGTTSPYRLLSVNADGVFGGDVRASTFTATSSITSSGTITASATTTAPYFAASALGVVGSPAFTFSGDLDTGFWSPGANTFALSTAGSERLRLTTDGYLGLGQTAPAAMLDVSSPNTVTALRVTNSTNSNNPLLAVGAVASGNDANLTLYNASGAASVYLTASSTATSTFAGFIDVNGTGTNATSTFASNLWVKGGLQIGTGSLHLTGNSIFSTDGSLRLSSTGYASSTQLTTTGATYLATTGGNVGIGTASPAYKLDIAGTVNATGAITGGGYSGGAISGTTIGASGLITSTASGAIFTRSGASTAAHYLDLNNDSGRTLIGVEGAAAGGLVTGSTAYAMVLDTGATGKPIQFGISDAIVMTMLTGGNVGIGTSTPTASYFTTATLLDISGANAAAIRFERTSATVRNWEMGITTGGNFDIIDTVASLTTPRLRIDTSGNVGIGTTGPGAKLDVGGITGWGGNNTGLAASISGADSPINGGGNFRILGSTSAAINKGGTMTLGGMYTGATNMVDFGEIAGRKENVTDGNANGYLAFSTRDNSAGQREWMRITSAGNVGIGTTTPDASFRMTVTGSSAGVGPGILFTDTVASPTNYAAYINGSKNFVIRDQTAGADRITVQTSTGNVGIGTTNPIALLTVNGANQAFGAAYNAGRGNLFIKSSSATAAIDTGGTLSFGGTGRTADGEVFNWATVSGRKETATSGETEGYLAFETTSGVTNLLTERMRITSTGNVGIGTTGPLAKLAINGGLHVGGDSDPGDNNALIDGTLGVTGATTIGAASGGVGALTINHTVQPTIYLAKTNATASTWQIYNNGNLNFYDGTNNPLAFIGANSYFGGSVGIGTTEPVSLAHVSGTSPYLTVSNSATDYADDTVLGVLNFYSNDGSTTSAGGIGSVRMYSDTAFNTGASPSYMAFYTHDNTGNDGTVLGDVTERMRIDSSGNVAIGASTLSNHIGTNPHLQVSSIATAGPSRLVGVDYWAADADGAILSLAKSRGATVGTYTYPNAGDVLGQIEFLGAYEANGRFDPGAAIRAVANTTWTASNRETFLRFYTTPSGSATLTEQMRITGAGSVGIGTTSPQTKLEVNGDMMLRAAEAGPAYYYIYADEGDDNADKWVLAALATNGNFEIQNASTGNWVTSLAIQSSGNAVFTGSGGTCTINGSGACTSDARLKTNIEDISGADALAGLAKINGVTYNWIDPSLDQSQRVGVIAQDVLQAFPQLVGAASTTLNGVEGSYYTVNYAGLVSPLIAGVNELNARFAVPSEMVGATTTPSAVLTADGKYVDLYALATYSVSSITALGDRLTALETHMATLEERLTALESGAISTASGSPLALSSSTLASALEGFGVLIQQGIAQFQTLVFRQLVASSDADGTSSAGSVAVLAGNTVAQVQNSLVLPSTKVFVTFNSQITGSWWVSDKLAGSFRVVLSEAQAGDVSFDYFLVQTEGQLATSSPSTATPSSSQQGLTLLNDITAPVITLLGDNPLYLSVGGTFVEPGVSITDNADGVISTYVTYVNGIEAPATSDSITTGSEQTYIITYKATDARGNFSTATRSVIVGASGAASGASGGPAPADSAAPAPDAAPADTTAPVVTLAGDAAIQLMVGDTFTDPGATATDDTDGDLTAGIVVTGAVDTATEGSYQLTYSATDAAGNTGSASRLVTVVAASAPAAPQP